jgi:hypothetical protein
MREEYLVSFTISERNYVHRSQREKRESTYFIISLSERESVVVRTREGGYEPIYKKISQRVVKYYLDTFDCFLLGTPTSQKLSQSAAIEIIINRIGRPLDCLV